MSIYSYARVSTKDQNLTQQLKELAKYNPDFKYPKPSLVRPLIDLSFRNYY
jgi:DNA invertase Pin-like site-specific DNA recombinase